MEQLSLKDEIRELVLELKAYLETRYDIARLEAVEATAVIATIVLVGVIVLVLGLFTLLFTSFAIAFFLASTWKNNALGFGAVAASYLFLTLTMYMFRNQIFRRPILRRVITLLLPEKNNTSNN